MCSIIGYRGRGVAAPILVHGLKRMEYRGYDSVGVATRSRGRIQVRKGVGGVSAVNESAGLDSMKGTIGIGHTRWASHGGITDINAHPHSSSTGGLALVHNGIVENHKELKEELLSCGFTFESETDTEVLANLLQKNYDDAGDILEAVLRTVRRIRGDYAFVAMFGDGTLAAARLHVPLIIGVRGGAHFLSSDVLGFIEKTDDAIYMDSGDVAVIGNAGLDIYDFEGNRVRRPLTKVSKEFADVYRGEFAHFTQKEISEQPDTVLRSGEGAADAIEHAATAIRDAGSAYITGSGTSYNAALVARYLLSKYAGVRLEPIISSEMPFTPGSIDPGSVLIAISQSGESADVLEAVRIAKGSGARVISIVNMLLSPLAQESSQVLAMNCGPEIGVAATKSFTAQLAVIYQIVDRLCHGCLKVDFGEISHAISGILADYQDIRKIASELRDSSDIYVLGRGIHHPIAAEAALKLKELSYIHAEGIPGGELKHGPLALMGPGTHVIVINPDDETYQGMINSTSEIKARGARIIGVSDRPSDLYDHWIRIPKLHESIYPIVEIVPIQLLSYYTALERDTNPDRPRNLAKSVTVR
jgi:glucosamine--fructose-6-phosphate aminotransferase (isomerizing)